MKSEVEKNISTLPSNKEIAIQVLEILNNNKTKIEENSDIKGCYYSFVNDTMYISTSAKNMQDINRAIVVCHECKHSIQNKKLQLVNTIVSNLLLILYVLQFILIFISKEIFVFCYMVAGISAIVRGVLEVDATINSLNIFKQYLKNINEEKNIDLIDKYFSVKLKVGAFFYFFKVVFDKFLPIVTLQIINLLKCHIIK